MRIQENENAMAASYPTLSVAIEQHPTRPQNAPDCYQYIVDTLTHWGITLYTGVTGGGVIHFLKHLPPLQADNTGQPGFLNFGEYVAGFVPLGYYLGSGRIAAAVATTGAATKLISCGLSDAKLHNIPAVYIVPVSGKSLTGFAPLQDSSQFGSNTIAQLRAELPDSVFVLDNPAALATQLALAKSQLDNSKPVVLILDNEALNNAGQPFPVPVPVFNEPPVANSESMSAFLIQFRQAVHGKRLVILVGEEMERYPHAALLVTEFSRLVAAAVIWSINGANAVERSNPYGYGYISFGGNDKALALYRSLGKDDVLLVLGACPDEYTINFVRPAAAHTFYLSNIPEAYGLVDNSLQHVMQGHYAALYTPLDLALQQLTLAAHRLPLLNRPAAPAPHYLNDRPFPPARGHYVNLATLYQQLDQWWPAHAIGFDDVCLAYKDRQYVTQRPNNHIRFYSLYRGSAMGGAFGAAVGAQLANPDQQVFLFTGDGCFRLFAGSLGEVAGIGLVVFLLNNETLTIVEQGLHKILPEVPQERYHARLQSLDYCGIARASGWEAERLLPDLSNLTPLLDQIREKPSRSLLIEVPVDPRQILGSNPRVQNL